MKKSMRLVLYWEYPALTAYGGNNEDKSEVNEGTVTVYRADI